MQSSLEVLGRAIKQVQWRHHRAADSRLRQQGLTLAQWDALRAISREPGATARRLAAETFQSEQAFGAMAAGMEANGLIVRLPGVGRRIQHQLTPHGERALHVGQGVMGEVLARSLGVLPDDQQDLLFDLLRRVLAQPEP